jgi:porin
LLTVDITTDSPTIRRGRSEANMGIRNFCLAGFLVLGVAEVANATPPMMPAPSEAPTTQPTAESGGPFSGLARSSNLFGDLFGTRTMMSRYGLTFTATETSEVLGNVTGGTRRGAAYDGLLLCDLQLDTNAAFGWTGGTFNVSALQIHGRNLSTDNLNSLQTASGIESDRSTRLWELWYQQQFGDEDKLDVRIGQQSLDQEFMVSQNALVFVNTMFGWPMVPSADLPGGGPAYPLSALGVRFKGQPMDALTVLCGVYNGSPVPIDDTGDPQKANATGVRFPLDGGALVIAEIQYTHPALGAMVYPNQPQPLSGVYKLGFWYDTESFADEEFDNAGGSLASSASTGIPRMHYGNYALYGVVDQMIWRDPDDDDRNWNFFFRPMGTPLGDRNLIDFSMNAGFVMHEPIQERDDDNFGIGVGYAHVSSRAADLDRDMGLFSGSYYPIRSGETFVELTYQYQLTPWCQLQPDFQYVFNPGGGVLNPTEPGKTIRNEAVFGMRVNIAF